jgi:hypothetical protein
MSRRIVVNRIVEREVYLHEVLEGLLDEINDRFDALTSPALKPGWKGEAVNGLIILAMVNEGWVNAIGRKMFDDWNPKQKSETRLRKICEKFLPELTFEGQPLKSVDSVRRIRNEFAHATPLVERRTDEAVTVEESDHRDVFRELGHPVEDEITVDNYRQFREDSAAFRELLLEKSGLILWDIKTKVETQSTFIREAE